MNKKRVNEDRLLLRPFPQGIMDDSTRQTLWKKYREDMISRAGVSVFLFGNKLVDGKVELANGMRSEYEIAVDMQNLIVPVGCTGYIAQEIWNEINKDLSAYYTNIDDSLKDAFAKLNLKCNNHDLVNNIISFIELFKNGKHSPV